MRHVCLMAAMAAALLSSSASRGQSTLGASLAERFGLNRERSHKATPVRHDPHLMPAAALSAGNRARAPKEAANVVNRKKGSGGLLGGMSLSDLIMGNPADDGAEPPMPYGPSTSSGNRSRRPSNSNRTNSSNTANRAQNQSQPGRRMTPSASRERVQEGYGGDGQTEMGSSSHPSANAMVRERQGATRAPSATRQPAAAQQVPAVARRSPVASQRRNELADALNGLGVDEEEASQEADSLDVTAIEETIEAPATEDDPSLPDYLRDNSSKGGEDELAGVEEEPANQELDVHEALDEEIAADSAKSTTAKAVATKKSPKSAPQAAARATTDVLAAVNSKVGTIPAATKPNTAAPIAQKSSGDDETKSAANRPTAQALIVATKLATRPISGGNLLLSCKQPVVVSHVAGPPRVLVGRQAEYQITIANTGEVSARDFIATIEAPANAEIVETSASTGVVDRAGNDPGAAKAVKWQLHELKAGASQRLTVQIVPRSGSQMQLGVRWTHAPAGGQATIDVQEPKLRMEIAGPEEVLFGKSQRYTLTLSNPGTGAAEEVSIELTPPGGDEQSVVHHAVGTLAAGGSKKIELELTAREAGQLQMKASAVAAGDLRSEVVKAVMCRRPALEVDWRGPEKQYAGAVATYFFRVRNPGTATADQVEFKLTLPAGSELVDASEGFKSGSDKRTVTWPGAGLNAGDERFMQVRCRFSQAGVNRLQLAAATNDGQLSDAKTAPITVVALADLKLEVSDPEGAAPVGKPAQYEIRIKNRGMTAARGVNVVAMFSTGIEPTDVEGAPHTIHDGRVAFHTIDSLAAGAEAVLRIQAVASNAGSHVFRAEVTCDDVEAKLAAEETTRFFAEDARWDDASTAYSDEAGTVKR